MSLFNRLKNLFPYFLVVAPIATHWGFWNLYKTYWSNTDPSTWYFLDSLAVFAGKTYTFVDHPGTPVQIIGSLLIALTMPFVGSGQALIDYYIARPEAFFFMTNFFLVIVNGLTAILLYRLARDTMPSKAAPVALAISLAYFAVHPLSARMLTYWQHNALYFAFGTLWWVLLYRRILEGRFSNRAGFLFGVAAGVLANIQVFFLPFLVTSVLVSFLVEREKSQSLWGGLRGAGWAVLGNISGIALMIVPIYRELPRFWKWISGILFSESLYGDGKERFFTLQALWIALEEWPTDNFVLMTAGLFVLVCLFIVWLALRKNNLSVPVRLSILQVVALVHAGFLVMLLTRGYVRPRYSLSMAALLPILLLVLFQMFSYIQSNFRLLSWSLAALMAIGTFQNVSAEIQRQIFLHYLESELAASRSIVIKSFAKNFNRNPEGIVIVYAYGTPLQCASLVLANDWLAVFDREIGALCPNQYAIYTAGISVNLNSNRPLADVRSIPWDIIVASDEPLFFSLLGDENIKNVPGDWGVPRRSWFFIRE